MRVSVVTISYNQGKFLNEAIDSVLSQRGVEIEYIIVDPGSTDGSLEIIGKYGHRIQEAIIGKDSGPANALNLGLQRATGDLFYYLNADDVALPRAFELAAREFEDQPDLDILLGSGWVVDVNGRTVRPVRARRFTPRRYVYGAAVALQQATFFRRASIAPVQFNEKNRASWDGEFLLDLVLAGKQVKTTNLSLGHFRWYDESLSGSGILREALDQELQRNFHKVMGRPWRSLDKAISLSLRSQRKLTPALKPSDIAEGFR